MHLSGSMHESTCVPPVDLPRHLSAIIFDQKAGCHCNDYNWFNASYFKNRNKTSESGFDTLLSLLTSFEEKTNSKHVCDYLTVFLKNFHKFYMLDRVLTLYLSHLIFFKYIHPF